MPPVFFKIASLCVSIPLDVKYILNVFELRKATFLICEALTAIFCFFLKNVPTALQLNVLKIVRLKKTVALLLLLFNL